MSTSRRSSSSTSAPPTADPRDLLAYLLKHVTVRLTHVVDAALEPYGIDSKDFGTLRVLAGREPSSQLQVAKALGIDRTTMVALLDELERKKIITRRPDPGDRRRNVVELTEEGARIHASAEIAYAQAENAFLEPLRSADAERLRVTLRALLEA